MERYAPSEKPAVEPRKDPRKLVFLATIKLFIVVIVVGADYPSEQAVFPAKLYEMVEAQLFVVWHRCNQLNHVFGVAIARHTRGSARARRSEARMFENPADDFAPALKVWQFELRQRAASSVPSCSNAPEGGKDLSSLSADFRFVEGISDLAVFRDSFQ